MFGSPRAPEIAIDGLEWFNVPAPLSLAALRGKLVILDFWTFCCVNCMHILPTLRLIEARWPEEVAVIGVHSPKFAAEREAANLIQAIARYGIAHPVVNDPEFQIWRRYGVRAWPTLAFLGPDGSIIDMVPGEPDPERLEQVVEQLLETAREQHTLAPAPLGLEAVAAATGRLAFPGKMKRLERGDGERVWALTDGGHHQLVVLDREGRELQRIGRGDAGFADGALGQATFNGPQGLVCERDIIYVADTANHAIRKIDLAAGTVATLAGTGRRGQVLGAPAPAHESALASVWDLELDGPRLYFANAGSHQLGLLDLDAGTVERLAGDGGEAIEDGPADSCRLAQPSGLALGPDRRALYFVDAETSAVRAVSLGPVPQVTTLIGTGLFDFGHVNGGFTGARFQHPLGIAGGDGRLVVADSYNRALRVLDLKRRRVADLDDGYVCEDELCLPPGEPAGVALDEDGRIYMVDTNNHRVVAYRPADRAYRTWCE